MGTPIGDLVVKREISLETLRGKRIAVDAFNTLYQFLSTIRGADGRPLRDSKGRVTSHLSGLLYRTAHLVEKGIKPVYVFDGEPPEFKRRTVEERREHREEMRKKWEEALERGDLEEARKYAQGALGLTDEMISESKELLDLMGIPYVQAPSEGEAQGAYMVRKGEVWAVASQDYDSLLFGAPRLVRYLAVTGKRKLPNREIYVEVSPEEILLEETLRNLGIDRRKLIWIGLLLGTDYNEKVKGVGPKKALELVRSYDSFETILRVSGGQIKGWEEIERFFLNPPVTDDYELKWREPDTEGIVEFMCKERDFSEDRVRKAVEKLWSGRGEQTSLEAWFS